MKIVSYKNELSDKSINAVHVSLGGYNFSMDIKDGKSESMSSVTFKSSGDPARNICKNDSLFCYYGKFNTFSIQCNDEPYYIIERANQRGGQASLLFKKRGKNLYIAIMTEADGNLELQPGQLYDLVNK